MSSGVVISGQQLFAALLVDCVIVSLTFYEHLITLEQEIRVIWRRKLTGATVLFVVNRYATLLLAVLILVSLSSGDARSCSITRKVIELLVTILSLTFLAFSTLRTYAIAGHNRFIWTIPVLILTFVPIPIDVFYWTISRDFYVRNPHACVRLVNLPTKQLAIGTELAYRGSLCFANFIMLSLVLQRTLHIYLQSRAFKIRTPLVQALLRDGAIFFFTFLILNLVTLLAEFIPALAGLLPTSSLLQEVTSILLSRFMLNLRQTSETSETSGGTDGPSTSRFTANTTTIGFRIPQSVIGNLAESFAEEAEIDYEPDNEMPSIPSPLNDQDTLPGSSLADTSQLELFEPAYSRAGYIDT